MSILLKSAGRRRNALSSVEEGALKHLVIGGLAALAMGGAAHANGLERSDQSVAVLFQQGRYIEFSASYTQPDASGVLGGRNSGNIAEDFNTVGFAFKDDINKNLSYALIYDEPYGTNISYPTGTGYLFAGAKAELTTRALTGILQYNIGEAASAFGGQFSVYGGPRAQYIRAEATVPVAAAYNIRAEGEFGYGYLLGAAWERPDLGMRASLTYTSDIKYSLNTTETSRIGNISSQTSVETPESITLELRTGITPTTALFGSVRYVPWSDFVVAPQLYKRISPAFPLAFFEDDRVTYNIGIGQAITKNVSVFGILGYVSETGSLTSNLTPVDGLIRYTLGTNIKIDNATLTIAGRYTELGDARTINGADFTDTSAWTTSVKLGFDLN
jgi:long-chain fatty acid transport protein